MPQPGQVAHMVYALGCTDTGLLVMLTQERRQAQGLEAMSRCCQTNSNSSQLGLGGRLLCQDSEIYARAV